MHIADLPENEEERLDALLSYNLLDTEPEKEFDDLSKLAAYICDAPIAMISLIDEKRKWYKSKVGTEATEMPRESALCSHTLIEPQGILVVPDAKKDQRFYDNPIVTGDSRVIFYLGVTLVDTNGFALGTLCVIDHKPREVSEHQIDSIVALSNQVVRLFELRRMNKTLLHQKSEHEKRAKELEQLAYVVSHDIKSPLINITSLIAILKDEVGAHINESTEQLFDHLGKSTSDLRSFVDRVLDYYRTDRLFEKDKEEIELTSFFKSIVDLMDVHNEHSISYPGGTERIKAHKVVLEQIFMNLIGNSIKYCDKEQVAIDVQFRHDRKFYQFTVSDNGPGIPEEDHKRVFDLFTTLKYKDRNGERGNGIGLSTVKKLVAKSEGLIKLSSEPGKGCSFEIKLRK